MALTKEIIQFAEGNTDFYEGAVDFYHNPSVEKNEILNKAFFAEVERKSGVSRDGLTSGAWIANPQVHWVR